MTKVAGRCPGQDPIRPTSSLANVPADYRNAKWYRVDSSTNATAEELTHKNLVGRKKQRME